MHRYTPPVGYDGLQFGVGAGSFNGEDALSFGAAKRVGDILFNGTIGQEGSHTGIGFGANWRF